MEVRAETQNRNQKGETEAETLEEALLLACFLQIQYQLSSGGNTHSGLVFSMSIVNHKNGPQTSLQARLMKAFSQDDKT